MPVALTGENRIVQQNEKVVLGNGHNYKSTKNNQNKPGRWYYEFTHYSGNQRHLAGFQYDSGSVEFYPWGTLSNTHFYFAGSEINPNAKIPFALQSVHTIGVGIDTHKNIFYVFYENNFAYYNFSVSKPIKSLNVILMGASIDKANDEISVNFGAFPFKYNISGFTPWEFYKNEKTCYHKMNKQISPLNSIMILVLFSK